MKTAQRKTKHRRRRHHQKQTRSVSPIDLGFMSLPGDAQDTFIRNLVPEAADYQVEAVKQHLLSEVPTRAKCPSCGFSQKVRRSGLMSRHDVYLGSEASECPGSKMRYDTYA